MSDGLTVEKVVRAYMSLRSKKEQIEAKVKEELTALDIQMTKLEAWLLKQADTQGVTSFKTAAGTAFVTTTDYAKVENWDAVLKFIKENEAYDLLTRKVNKTAVRGYIDANKAIPDGVTYGTQLGVNIRRPAARVED